MTANAINANEQMNAEGSDVGDESRLLALDHWASPFPVDNDRHTLILRVEWGVGKLV